MKKECGNPMRSAQKTAILKKGAAVFLVILAVLLLSGMYVHYQTTIALARKVEDLKEKYNENSVMVKAIDNLKATKGALIKEIDDLKGKCNQTSALAKEVFDLKATNGALRLMVKQLVKDSKCYATGKLSDLKKFFDSDEKSTKNSESFVCHGLSWYLNFEHSSLLGLRGLRGLGVLLCQKITQPFGNNFHDWSANVTFSLTLVNHDDRKSSRTLENNYVFVKNSPYNCYGWSWVASPFELYNGFAKEDALDFEVHFKKLDVNLID